jgi:hypothetical protein
MEEDGSAAGRSQAPAAALPQAFRLAPDSIRETCEEDHADERGEGSSSKESADQVPPRREPVSVRRLLIFREETLIGLRCDGKEVEVQGKRARASLDSLPSGEVRPIAEDADNREEPQHCRSHERRRGDSADPIHC